VHLSDLNDVLEHLMFVGWNAGTAGLNAATENFANNFT
jgi:hypothetical protein